MGVTQSNAEGNNSLAVVGPPPGVARTSELESELPGFEPVYQLSWVKWNVVGPTITFDNATIT